jgi:hypothetical protein
MMIKEIEKLDVGEEEVYIYLKYLVLKASILKSIGMSHLANNVCNRVFLIIRRLRDLGTPTKSWLSGVKAARI